ncbi:MAG: lecithin retinol acyltransferase family protein [Acidimicrobiales bacterium]
MSTLLSPGDHIRVLRFGYWHYGIYISDERVIESGANIWEKRRAIVQAVSLAAFASGNRVVQVEHMLALPSGDDSAVEARSEEAVHRAEMLLEFHPEGKYNQLGRNCERIATFCVTRYGDSPQVRQYLFATPTLGPSPKSGLFTTRARK